MSEERILLRAPSWIGDAVMALPALERLRGLFPRSAITVLSPPRTSPIFENHPVVNGIIAHDKGSVHRGPGGFFKIITELKKRDFGLAVLLQNSFESAFLSYMAGIPEAPGYSRHYRGILLTKPIVFDGGLKKAHQVFYYLNIIKELGAATPAISPYPFGGDIIPVIRLKDEEIEKAGEFLKKRSLNNGSLFFGVAPGASYGPAKIWTGYEEAVEEIAVKTGMSPVIFGGRDDRDVCATLSKGLKVKHLNLAGTTGLREFMALAREMKFFVTNDSGPMHVAAALGVPTVAIFGSTDPSLTGPLGKSVRVIMKKQDCSPCFKRECPYGHYRCMRDVTPADVVAGVQGLLAGVPGV